MPEIIFTGPAGRLEGRYHPARQKNAPIAIVLHPHPQFGGTMTMVEAAAEAQRRGIVATPMSMGLEFFDWPGAGPAIDDLMKLRPS